MKFRHFEFRLFPKLRSKKKKKPKICNPDFPRDIGLDKNFNYSKTSRYGYYDNLAAEDNIDSDLYSSVSDVNYDDSSDGGELCKLQCYKNYTLPELKISVDDYCDCSCISEPGDGVSSQIVCSHSHPNGMRTSPTTPSTIPRTRTRIKTNPWLPSPKASPAPSPTETTDSILFTTTTEVAIPYLYPLVLEDKDKSISTVEKLKETFALKNGTVENKKDIFSFSDGIIKSIHEEVPLKNNITDETEAIEEVTTEIPNFFTEKPKDIELNLIHSDTKVERVLKLKKFTYAQFLTYDSSATSTPVTDGHFPIGGKSEFPNYKYESKADALLESTYIPRTDSFEYFEIADTMIETEKSDTEKKCEFELTDNKTEELSNKNSDEGNNSQLSLDMDIISADDENKDVTDDVNISSVGDWTFCDDTNMHTSTDTGYASISRDTDSITSTDDMYEHSESKSDDGLEWDNEPTAHNLIYNLYQRKQLMTCSLYTEKDKIFTTKRSRSLADIEMSLDEKVSRLRAEKMFVQIKIREAIEEEILRRRQLRVFRSVSPDNRKDLLVKTLYDLKSRLENQSARLQSSYDTVLSLQKRFSKRTNGPQVIETSI